MRRRQARSRQLHAKPSALNPFAFRHDGDRQASTLFSTESSLPMESTSYRPLLIIVTGPSGTGKTWLSKRLAQDLHLPGLHRDDLKERLFDTLGIKDRAWSRRLGGASYELLFHTLALLLQTDHPCLIESNFYGEPATTKICTLIQQ
jgi:hypothetical protein